MKIPFTKMHGCGNDFIMIDHRQNFLQENQLPLIAQKLCERRLHIGANGLMLLENSDQADFSMRYFNRDGSEGEMCGNGARCIVQFAYTVGACQAETTFETLDGIYEARILENGQVKLTFPDVSKHKISMHRLPTWSFPIYRLWVGVPHAVIFAEDIYLLDDKDFHHFGEKIRYLDALFSHGTNVNVVASQPDTLAIRTYERGVEEETLACGSGATATAIIGALYFGQQAPVTIQTKGGPLMIDFIIGKESIQHLSLTGEAVIVFHGTTTIDEGDIK